MGRESSGHKEHKGISELTIYIDGAAKGNPGQAGIGIVIQDKDKVMEINRYIGKTTNNVAEYIALIEALIAALRLEAKVLKVFSDSELLVRQIKGMYKIKSANLLPLNYLVNSLIKNFQKVSLEHISRKDNKRADNLANLAIKEQKLKVES